MKNIIEVHDLTVSYNKKPVLWDVDFDLPEGQLIGIIGPNGAGKSTLLKSIMGLLEPQSGYVKVWDKNIEQAKSRISYVPQRESVDWDFPASVFDIALMGRYQEKGLFKRITKEDKEIALSALKQVNLTDFIHRQISELSGGQQQRTFLARALAQNADLYLMDEPFAGVDAASEASIIELLKEMKAQGKTIIVVHHDLQSAPEYFDWMIMLNTVLTANGPTSEVFNKENLQKTYGGKLTLLSKIGNLMEQSEFPTRQG